VQRYYVPKENWEKDAVLVTKEDAHHIKRVMRQQVGDQMICNHPSGKAARCIIDIIADDYVKARIMEWLEDDHELPVKVTIAQGLPKGNKLELILQKGTELGAAAFQLFEADRSIAKWDVKKAANRFKRFDKIIKEASEQCHRNLKPTLYDFQSLHEIVTDSPSYDHIIVGYEEEAKREIDYTFGDVLSTIRHGQSILIVIGPEGGFSKEEVIMLKEHGAIPVRFGKRILRTETASLYALASISYHFEELRCSK